jgi:hypothetical protein
MHRKTCHINAFLNAIHPETRIKSSRKREQKNFKEK